jgi:predicted nucleotidyltransferase
MKFGLTQEQFDFIQSNVVKRLSLFGAKVWCFGSRARGDHQKFSDLDLLIDVDQDVSSTLSAIREDLENSNFGLKVDLVLKAEIASSYKAKILKEKVLFT